MPHRFPSHDSLKKGELVAYREQLIKIGHINELGFLGYKFNPKATVQGFVGLGKHTFTDTGVAMSQFMTAVDGVPPCLNAIVEVTYADGRESKIKFHHGG